MGLLDQLALRHCSKYIAPDLISLGGREAENNNFYSVYVHNAELGEDVFVLKSIRDDTVSGVIALPDRTLKPYSFHIGNIDNSEICVNYYYRGRVFSYRSGLRFFISKALFLPQLSRIVSNLKDRRLKRRTLHRSSKAEILEAVIANANKWRYGFDNLQLFMTMHSVDSLRSDAAEDALHFQDMVLKSLVETGEIDVIGAKFKLNPKAFSSLLDWRRDAEIQERTYQNQKALNRLTFLVVIATFVGAFSNVFSEEIKCAFNYLVDCAGDLWRLLLSL